jgi:hypothetical protein
MTYETWYVLDDGSVGDPHQIVRDAFGVLRHRDGRVVAYGPHGPRSRGHVDAAAERIKVKAETEAAAKNSAAQADDAALSSKDMKPDEPKRSYKTRESKADEK